MDWLQEITNNKTLQNNLTRFLKTYGTSGLNQALAFYADMQQEYICKTRTSISKIKICDIYYLEIQEHNITIHTLDNTYTKYGTLNAELKVLASYNFVKCNQSCIVSLTKIKAIRHTDIILLNNTKIHLSRSCTKKVISMFTLKNIEKSL